MAPAKTGRPSTETTAAEEVMESTRDREFICATEVHYHNSRQAFFEGAHRWAMFAVIFLGASAATPFVNEKLLLLYSAVICAADIAFDWTGRAQRHADLRRRYYDLVSDLCEGLDEERLNFERRYMAISADEPPPYRWAQEVAHRNAAISLGREIPAVLPLWKRALAHLWRG